MLYDAQAQIAERLRRFLSYQVPMGTTVQAPWARRPLPALALDYALQQLQSPCV
jgi:hypothetical protein